MVRPACLPLWERIKNRSGRSIIQGRDVYGSVLAPDTAMVFLEWLMKISIFGIGYVGAVTAACLSRDGHSVIATDVNAEKVSALVSGASPIVEPGLDELLVRGVQTGLLSATTNVHDAIHQSNISFICVGTPAQANGSLNLEFVMRVSDQIGSSLKQKDGFHSVVMRSTMLPGSMDEVVIPRLETASGKRVGDGFGVAYYPEFLREGSAIKDYDDPGAIVFGGRDARTLDRLARMYSTFPVTPIHMDIRAAEAVKYANNAWHAIKISFANELGLVCKSMGVDSHDVMETLCSDRKLNISPAYLRPGFAFGGSCLPKDLKALRYGARKVDLDTPLLDAVLAANEHQLRHTFEMIEALALRNVGIIGLSFKPETDDLRYSPFVELAERLLGRGYRVKIYDPIVRLSRLTGANHAFVAERLPHIADLLVEEARQVIEHSDVLVIGNKAEAQPLMPDLQKSNKHLIDVVRVDRTLRTDGQYQGLCW
jgi:GDP-mannose 6-dehydrogenase